MKTDLSETESIATSIRAYDKECIGCQRHSRDIMISYTKENDAKRSQVYDLFLTQGQAKMLYEELGRQIAENEV